MCSAVSSSAVPTGTTRPGRKPAVSGLCAENSVPSVAPYIARITTSGQTSSTRRTAPGAITSPPVRISASPARLSGDSSAMTRNSPAVRWIPVIRSPAIRSRSVSSWRLPGGATTIRPPCSSGIHSS